MGSMLDGIQPMITYAAGDSIAEKFTTFLAALPDPDSTDTSGSVQGIPGYLDEMQPMAVAQLRLEIAELKEAILGGTTDWAFGSYTAVAADATANLTNITTGLADIAAGGFAVTVWRAGSNVTGDAAITEPSAGVIRVADGSTFVLTAGDIIYWAAKAA